MKRLSGVWLGGLVALTFVAAMTLRSEMAQASAATFTCHPDRVVSANTRVVARCPSGYPISGGPTIVWFAYPTSDSANASRMLSVFETANAMAATVTFYFDTDDLSGSAYGCATNDCRAIWAATTP